MAKIRRILAVTGGLVLTGAVAGALLGAFALVGEAAVVGGLRELWPLVPLVALGAATGAVIGAVLAPVAAWALLRTVPLGRAVAETAVGTLLGAVVAWFVPAIGPIFGGVVGFGVAAARLGLIAKRRRAAEQSLSAPPG